MHSPAFDEYSNTNQFLVDEISSLIEQLGESIIEDVLYRLSHGLGQLSKIPESYADDRSNSDNLASEEALVDVVEKWVKGRSALISNLVKGRVKDDEGTTDIDAIFGVHSQMHVHHPQWRCTKGHD